MALPIRKRSTGTLHFHGEDIELRSLTADEVSSLQGKTLREVNVACIGWSFGMSPSDAEAWYDSADAGDAMAALVAVNTVSGLDEGARFQRGASAPVVDERPGV